MKNTLAALSLLFLVPTLGAQVEITEFSALNDTILADEDGDYSDWIELGNAGAAVDIGGWYLTDDSTNLTKWQFPFPTNLAAGNFHVLFASSKNRSVSGLELHTNFKLKSGGEYLALIRPDGFTVEDEYSAEFPVQYSDITYGVAFDPGPTSERTYFIDPTPGVANSLGGPVVMSVNHTPEAPVFGEDISVVAELTSDVTSATLMWRVMFGSDVALGMKDDGTGGDLVADDGLWTAKIPGGSGSEGEMVRWYVEASDSRGVTGKAPLFEDPENSPEYFGTLIADPLISTPLNVFYWFVEDPLAAGTVTGSFCSLFYGGEFYDNVAVRTRGGASLLWPKPNYKFDFHSGYHFRLDPDEKRVEEFNLNSTYSDKSYIRRNLAWETYASAGANYCLSLPLRVQQNNDFHSVAIAVEQMDEDYLKRNDLDKDGALYKMFNPGTSSVIDVEKKTRLHEDHSDLQAFLVGVAIANPGRTDYLFDNADLPAMVNYLAVTSLIHDNDHLSKNHYLYRDSDGDGEWRFLPWDKDLTFGRNYTLTGLVLNDEIWADIDPFGHPLYGDRDHRKVDNVWNIIIDAIYESPRLQEMVMRRLRTVMDDQLQSPWNPKKENIMEQRIAELHADMASDVALDFAKWGTDWGLPLDFLGGLNQILDEFLVPRRDHLYVTHGPASGGLIPIAQADGITVTFGNSDPDPVSGNPLEEYLELSNPHSTSVDLSNWSIDGDITMTFPAGTVIPASDSVYLCRDLPSFRSRAIGPAAGQSLIAIGPYSGDLLAIADLQLFDHTGTLVFTNSGPVHVTRNMSAGETAMVQVIGGDSGDTFLFAYSLAGPGPTQTPFGFADLSAPIYRLGTATVNSLGTSTISSLLPSRASGVTVWTQAFNLQSSTFTNNLVNTL